MADRCLAWRRNDCPHLEDTASGGAISQQVERNLQAARQAFVSKHATAVCNKCIRACRSATHFEALRFEELAPMGDGKQLDANMDRLRQIALNRITIRLWQIIRNEAQLVDCVAPLRFKQPTHLGHNSFLCGCGCMESMASPSTTDAQPFGKAGVFRVSDDALCRWRIEYFGHLRRGIRIALDTDVTVQRMFQAQSVSAVMPRPVRTASTTSS